MKFATRTAQDITPQDLAQRLYSVEGNAERAKALELLKSANPETITDAELRGVLGALVLVARDKTPPTTSEVRSTATVARAELERLFRALDEADRLLRRFRDVRTDRALDARKIALNTRDPSRQVAAQAARRAREAEIGASLQYDGTVPPPPTDPNQPKLVPTPTLDQLRKAMLAGFVDRDLFPFDLTGLRYFEAGEQTIQANGFAPPPQGIPPANNFVELPRMLVPASIQPQVFPKLIRFTQLLPNDFSREFLQLAPETILDQFTKGLRLQFTGTKFKEFQFVPAPGAVTLEQVRQAMLGDFKDKKIFPLNTTDNLRYFETHLVPGGNSLVVGEAGTVAHLLVDTDTKHQPSRIPLPNGVTLLRFSTAVDGDFTKELLFLTPETVLANLLQGKVLSPVRNGDKLDVAFVPFVEQPLFDDQAIPPRDDFAVKHLDILRDELRALIDTLD